MKDAARPDPVAAAHRVKDGVRDLARGAIGAAGDLAADLAQGYRKSTRYFKLRAAVIGTWALLSVVTIWGACPSSGPSNSLGATAWLLPRSESLLGAQIKVTNESRRIWKDVVLTIEGGWRYEKRTLRPDESLQISVSQLTNGSAHAPPDTEARAITIECSEGRVTAPLQVVR
jgi:hypothetical protein